ncbi:MAG: riboflavin synthase [Phycisphaerales bacterium]|nr:riboflavin synthase [Phycisphaerales bacterium]
MFTGLIQGIGRVCSRTTTTFGQRLVIDAPSAMVPQRTGDSISVDGVCLTIVEVRGSQIAADVVPQTLSMTTLGSLAPDERVNLEAALRMGDSMGGHSVQGHIDSTSEVLAVDRSSGGWRIRLRTPAHAHELIVAHGSIAVDGVSLTVAQCGDGWYEVAIIPETIARTTLGELVVGHRVNVEVDLLARLIDAAVRRHLGARAAGSAAGSVTGSVIGSVTGSVTGSVIGSITES